MRNGLVLMLLFVVSGCGMEDKSIKRDKKLKLDSSVKTSIIIEDTAIENKIMDSLFKLPKIQKLIRYYDSLNVKKSGVSMMIIKRPISDTDYYVVQVGRDTKERFIGMYNFFVYKKGFEIKYSDPQTGEVIPVADWSKTKGL